jgi:hypothetical protein
VKEQVPLKRRVIDEAGPTSPAHLITFVFTVPAELDYGAAIPFGAPAVHPAADGDEAELAGLVAGELDESRRDEIDGVAVPQVHLHNSPPADQGRHTSSTIVAVTASSGRGQIATRPCAAGRVPTSRAVSVGGMAIKIAVAHGASQQVSGRPRLRRLIIRSP